MDWFFLILIASFYFYPLLVFDKTGHKYSDETKFAVVIFYILAIIGIFLAVERGTESIGFVLIFCPLLSYFFITNDKGPPSIEIKAKPKKFTGINVKTGRKVNFTSKANLNKAIKSGRTQSVEDYKAKQKMIMKEKLKEKQKALEKKLPYDIIK